MSRIGYHFLRTGTNDGSLAFIIIGIVIFIGYFIYKNKQSNYHSKSNPSTLKKASSEAKNSSLETRLFSYDELLLFREVLYKYTSLIEQGITWDKENYAGTITMCLNNIDNLSVEDFKAIDYCYESIMMVYSRMSSMLIEAGKMEESVVMINVAKQAAQCCDIIRKKTGITVD